MCLISAYRDFLVARNIDAQAAMARESFRDLTHLRFLQPNYELPGIIDIYLNNLKERGLDDPLILFLRYLKAMA